MPRPPLERGLGDCRVVSERAEIAARTLIERGERFDVVVLDPPRSGAASVFEPILRRAAAHRLRLVRSRHAGARPRRAPQRLSSRSRATDRHVPAHVPRRNRRPRDAVLLKRSPLVYRFRRSRSSARKAGYGATDSHPVGRSKRRFRWRSNRSPCSRRSPSFPAGVAPDHQLPAQGSRRARVAGRRRSQQERRDLLLRHRRRHHRGSRHARVPEGADHPRPLRRRARLTRRPKTGANCVRGALPLRRAGASNEPPRRGSFSHRRAACFWLCCIDREAISMEDLRKASQRSARLLPEDAEPPVAGRRHRHGLAGDAVQPARARARGRVRSMSSTRRFRK